LYRRISNQCLSCRLIICNDPLFIIPKSIKTANVPDVVGIVVVVVVSSTVVVVEDVVIVVVEVTTVVVYAEFGLTRKQIDKS